MPTLRISSRVQAYADTIPGGLAEPLQRYVDFEKFASGMSIREVNSDRRVIDPGVTLSLANVTFVTGIAVGALYDLKAHPTKTGRYQVRYKSGAISDPIIGLGTGLVTPANTYVVTLNADGSINIVDSSVSPVNFGLARGDTVYVAGTSFGDTGPFNVANQGFWTVVTCTSSGTNPGAKLVLKRVNPTDSTGLAETVTAAAALNIQKSTPISSVLLVGAPAYAGIWAVTETASGWFSIDSLVTLPDLLNISMTAMTLVPEQFLGYIRVEVDGPAIVRTTSGDLTQGQQVLRPVKFSDPLAAPVGGWLEMYGLLTQLSVQNVSDVPVSVNLVLAYVVG